MPEQKVCKFCLMEEYQGDRILEQKSDLTVILSNPYLVRGHTLIIPKRHVARLVDLTPEEWVSISATATEWIEHIKDVLSARYGETVGCDFTQHDRAFMWTDHISVPEHLHFHLRPRTLKDLLFQHVQMHETPMFNRQHMTPRKIWYFKAIFWGM